MFTRTLKASINEEGFSFNVWKITVRPVSSIDTDPLNLIISKRKLFPTNNRNSREERSLSFSNSSKFLPFFSLASRFNFAFNSKPMIAGMIFERWFAFVGLEIEWLESCNCFVRSYQRGQLLTRSRFALDQEEDQRK